MPSKIRAILVIPGSGVYTGSQAQITALYFIYKGHKSIEAFRRELYTLKKPIWTYIIENWPHVRAIDPGTKLQIFRESLRCPRQSSKYICYSKLERRT